jgi:hypothetical protein
MKRFGKNLQTAGLLALAAVVMTAVGFTLLSGSSGKLLPQPKGSVGQPFSRELLRLTNSNDVSERVAAARLLAEQPPCCDSNVIQAIGKALCQDEDAQVRAAIASSIGKSRRKFVDAKDGSFNEPQLLEIMLSAYLRESDASVRTEIVSAAAEFNHAEAAEIINMALDDHDSSVRETALRAKHTRDNRLQRARTV